MIVTVTTNPSIDRTIEISKLSRGEINRGELSSIDPAGKGVNVSRALASFGTNTHAIVVCGDLGSQWFSKKLNQLDISHEIIKSEGITRSNITIHESSGITTKINEPGFELTNEVIDQVKIALTKIDLLGSWVVFAGKLNPGADPNTYRDLAKFVKSRGAKVAIDGSGPEFLAAIEAKPDLIKPNQFELAELVGRSLNTFSDIVAASREINKRGVKQVLCSLGKDGAILITDTDAVHCEPVDSFKGAPVGAGDILLAIYLAGGANTDALGNAVAWSAASVPLTGTSIPTKAQAAAVKVNLNHVVSEDRGLEEVH